MPVVRGDRIGESTKLNRCSFAAQNFYALFIASVPDDFGRFRVSTAHVALRMYPRREPSPALVKQVAGLMRELSSARLWKSWRVDGIVFAELALWKPCGNLYHRTPEPPVGVGFAEHHHTRRCATTALARAREWKDASEERRLVSMLSGLGGTEAEQRSSRGRAEQGTEVEHPSPPSPPSPPSLHERTDTPPSPPTDVGGPFELPTTLERASKTTTAQKLRVDAERLERYWVRLGGSPTAADRRNIRSALRDGHSLLKLQGSIVGIVRDALVASGKLGIEDLWPPEGMAPYDSQESAHA